MSLLRYSGGKAKLAKKIVAHIVVPDTSKAVYLEPFVGGGSVALEVAARYPNIKLMLNDKEPEIANFWNQIANSSQPQFLRLYDRVRTCQPTIAQFKELKAAKAKDNIDRAFRTLFFNRTGFAPSNGKRPLGGWGQAEDDGTIGERWNSERLVKEMLDARVLLYERTTVLNEDFDTVMALANEDWTMYLDPPYYKAGNQLYNHPWKDEDHVRLRERLKTSPANWVLSYDFHPRIVDLYNHGMTRSYPMPASYSIAKRREVEALFVPNREDAVMISSKGFTAPKNFEEFYNRYPDFVRLVVEQKMRWSQGRSRDEYTVFTAQVDDYTQELLLFLSALPKESKYRAMGFTDPIQLFNPSLWGSTTRGKFLAYVKMLLNNRFHTLRTHEHKDALPFADTVLGAVRDVDFMDDTAVDFQTYRAFVERERPSLLATFDAFLDRDLRDQIPEYEFSRARLVGLLQQYYVYGKAPRRKEYKKRSDRKA